MIELLIYPDDVLDHYSEESYDLKDIERISVGNCKITMEYQTA